MSLKLNAAQLRKGLQQKWKTEVRRRNAIYIILENVLDTYNIGSIFRLADAIAAKKVYLCGATATPPNHRIKKASINTTEFVEWEYCETAIEAIKRIRGEFSTSLEQYSFEQYSSREAKPNREVPAIKIVAVEQNERSIPYDKYDYKFPIALIVGNETTGVTKEVLDLCDGIVELPMFGVNISLNVMVSLGIVLYQAVKAIDSSLGIR